MQCSSDLVKLRDAIISRSRHFRQITSSISSPLSAEERRTLAFVTIELDNLVIVGLRQYTKSSLLKSRTASGARITSSVSPADAEEAAAFIYRSLNPRGYANAGNPPKIKEKDEIPFRDPKKVEKVLTDYSTSNLPNLSLALSLNANVFSEVKTFRHFFAHRAQNTYQAVRDFAMTLAIMGFDRPEHLILQGRPGTGVRFLDGWLADIENFFDLAT